MFFGTLIFIFLLSSKHLFILFDLIFNLGISANTVLYLFNFLLPELLSYAIPISLLFAIIIAFGRWQHDNEILALKTSGLNLLNFFFPPLFLASLSCIALIYIHSHLAPYFRSKYKELLRNALERAALNLKEKTFNFIGDNYVLYFNRKDENHMLKEVCLFESKPEQQTGVPELRRVFTAREGMLKVDHKKDAIVLTLTEGKFYQRPMVSESVGSSKGEQTKLPGYYTGTFKNLNLEVDLTMLFNKFSAKEQKRIKEMTNKELLFLIKNSTSSKSIINEALVTFHRRLALPFAAIVFVFLGIPLGIFVKFSSKFFGLLLCVFSVFVYYIILTIGEAFGNKGVLPPVVAVWLPNLILGTLGIILSYRIIRS